VTDRVVTWRKRVPLILPSHLVHSGPRIALRRPRMRAISDLELTVGLIRVLEIIMAAKCRSKTFVFIAQSFAQ